MPHSDCDLIPLRLDHDAYTSPMDSESERNASSRAIKGDTAVVACMESPKKETCAGGEAGGKHDASCGGAWSIDFTTPKLRRKVTAKERQAIAQCRLRKERGGGVEVAESRKSVLASLWGGEPDKPAGGSSDCKAGLACIDSEGNATIPTAAIPSAVDPDKKKCGEALPVISVCGLEDSSVLIPTGLNTTRDDLARRFVLRIPRLLCVTKQYPRSCGISSLTSIYNYLYSGIGETAAYAHLPPISQEEIMTILGFEFPFGDVPWGSFTGNITLIRWFYALNRHFGRKSTGRAYILYKAHGSGKTTHLYTRKSQILAEVKKALADPYCALIYHCYNHYMVPVGYQDVPLAQVDFYKPHVPEEDCETSIFIGEVSRGRHEAMYARKWSLIEQDIECRSPFFFNIRRPELGVQRKTSKTHPQRSSNKPELQEGRRSLNVAAGHEGGDTTAKSEKEKGGLAEDQQKGRRLGHHEPEAQSLLLSPTRPTYASPTNAGGSGEKKGGGNLHCLICFRNDQVENDLQRYEHIVTDSLQMSSSDSLNDDTEVDDKG